MSEYGVCEVTKQLYIRQQIVMKNSLNQIKKLKQKKMNGSIRIKY